MAARSDFEWYLKYFVAVVAIVDTTLEHESLYISNKESELRWWRVLVERRVEVE